MVVRLKLIGVILYYIILCLQLIAFVYLFANNLEQEKEGECCLYVYDFLIVLICHLKLEFIKHGALWF